MLQLDTEPQALESYLNDLPSKRLGSQFEALLAFWLEQAPDWELLARGLQVVDAGRTLGEFDFVVRNRETGRCYHWEVACKFYLWDPRAERWIGPGARDTFDQKLDWLHNHQLTLGQLEQGAQALRVLRAFPAQPISIIKGMLFDPAASFGATIGFPKNLNPFRLRGKWCALSDAEALLPQGYWRLIRGGEWLGIQCASNTQATYTKAELLRLLAAEQQNVPNRALLVARLQAQNEKWVEAERWAVAGPEWPQQS